MARRLIDLNYKSLWRISNQGTPIFMPFFIVIAISNTTYFYKCNVIAVIFLLINSLKL